MDVSIAASSVNRAIQIPHGEIMSGWRVTLLGKFTVECHKTSLPGLEARQVQELFSYLLLFRHRPQLREAVLEALWGDLSAGKARKKLRQTLWRLQSKMVDVAGPIMQIDNEWIEIVVPTDLWLDTEEFEKIYRSVNEKRISELSLSDLKKMQYAATLYKGDLLEGWYSDWCTFDRERFYNMHLILLDKLVQCCDLHQKYDLGLSYATEILRHDPAYERAHYQLMRLYILSGNRTQALHQYAHCTTALRKELGVEPSERTKQLHELIRSDALPLLSIPDEKMTSKVILRQNPALKDALSRLEDITVILHRLEHQIKEEVISLGGALSSHG
jgi:DNA-binding SARP family transcriptional activator